MIPFNKPYLSGKELDYIRQAVETGKISGDGLFTQKCHSYFQEKYGFKKCLLTTSCTDALEMAALLLNIQPGDEVILPSFTFVSTANAFVLRGATIVFADSGSLNPNIDVEKLESLITSRTRVIVIVHYAGIACEMNTVMQLAEKYHLWVVEDAAQAIDSYYLQRPLGSIGHLAAFSFHETKNVQSGEGGMLVINHEQFIERAEIIREKGTNRSAFFRGEIDKYGWVDIGSSFLPSEVTAAFLFAQLEKLHVIQEKRKVVWDRYYTSFRALNDKKLIRLPFIPVYATNNAHMFFIILQSASIRSQLIDFLKKENILSVFHYISLHKSTYYKSKHDGRDLPLSDGYTDHLLRLPMYYELSETNQDIIINCVNTFFEQRHHEC